jgi:hypothetical protein
MVGGSTKYLGTTADVLPTNGDISCSVWVKNSSEITADYYRYVWFKNTGNGPYGMIEYDYNGGTKRINAAVGGLSNTATYTVTMGTSDWYHIVLTRTVSDNITKLYVNGVYRSSSAADTYTDTGADYFQIGGQNTVNSAIATMDEVGVWSRALTATEVAGLYNDGLGSQYSFTDLKSAKVLVVGGGGGSESTSGGLIAGGGGAGGVVYNASFLVSQQAYTVTIGDGGTTNNNGGNSAFGIITAIGGGVGNNNGNGADGGSGGGGGYNTSSGGAATQGNSGGGTGYGNAGGGGTSPGAAYYTGGGGGGAGGAGASGSAYKGGNGGAGIADASIGGLLAMTSSGVSGYIAGGGGGAYGYGGTQNGTLGVGGSGGGGSGAIANYSGGDTNATSATANTGSGGGGDSVYNTGSGTGGSGLVIIAYTNADFNHTYTGTSTTGTDGSLTWVKMTTSGTFTLTSPSTAYSTSVTQTLNSSDVISRVWTTTYTKTETFTLSDAWEFFIGKLIDVRETLSLLSFSDSNMVSGSPGTMANDTSIGTKAWSNVDNAKVSDDIYAVVDLT